eukprot:g831.t1
MRADKYWMASLQLLLLLATPAVTASSHRNFPALSRQLRPDHSRAGHRAFYTVFSPMLKAPDWPQAYAPYRGGLVVMNPFNSSRATVQRVREDLNSTRVLMYFDTQDIQMKVEGKCVPTASLRDCSVNGAPWTQCGSGAMPCCSSFNCDAFQSPACPKDDYSAALQRIFKEEWSLRQLSDSGGQPVPMCLYGKGPLFVHSRPAVDALVPFLSDWVKSRGYDGVYFDEYFSEFVNDELRAFLNSTRLDADGDGKPDTLPQILAQYRKYQPVFSASLREALGADALIIANTRGVVDPALNGLTIEACDNPSDCVRHFEAQSAVAHRPLVSVMWLKGNNPSECAIASQMRKQLPYLLEGTDFYDGTHVVCNSTAAALS